MDPVQAVWDSGYVVLQESTLGFPVCPPGWRKTPPHTPQTVSVRGTSGAAHQTLSWECGADVGRSPLPVGREHQGRHHGERRGAAAEHGRPCREPAELARLPARPMLLPDPASRTRGGWAMPFALGVQESPRILTIEYVFSCSPAHAGFRALATKRARSSSFSIALHRNCSDPSGP